MIEGNEPAAGFSLKLFTIREKAVENNVMTKIL